MRELPKRLPLDIFLKSFENVPRVAINLIITDKENRVLLTRRNIEPSKGSWHFPGSFLLKNELIVEAQKRLAEDELGIKIENNKINLLGVFEDMDGDPRGHVIDVMYGLKVEDVAEVKVTKETLEVKFFDKLPEDMGFNHKETLEKLGFR